MMRHCRACGAVHVDSDGLSAWVHFMPGATFPPSLLEELLDVASITYGRQEAAIYSAGAAMQQARRLVFGARRAAAAVAAGSRYLWASVARVNTAFAD